MYGAAVVAAVVCLPAPEKAKGACQDPPAAVEELAAFPDWEAAKASARLAAAHLDWVQAQCDMGEYCAKEYAAWREEAEECWRCWHELEQAHYAVDRATGYCPDLCKGHLRQLRHLLGEENYLLGRLPCAVPVWRFRILQ